MKHDVYDKLVKRITDTIMESIFPILEGECGGDCGGGDCGAGFTGGDFGGVTSPYNTPYNTIGIGDPVPATFTSYGSGDRFDYYPFMRDEKPKKKGKKKRVRKINIYKKK